MHLELFPFEKENVLNDLEIDVKAINQKLDKPFLLSERYVNLKQYIKL